MRIFRYIQLQHSVQDNRGVEGVQMKGSADQRGACRAPVMLGVHRM